MTDQERGYEFVIERGKVREFATATKSQNAAYFEGESPLTPVTYAAAASFWAPRRQFRPPAGGQQPGSGGGGGGGGGRNMARVLDGGREYIFYGPPPRAGDTLYVTGRQVDQYTKEGRRGGTMTFTVSASEYRDASGKLVFEVRSTSIVTERAPTEGQS